MTDFLKRVNPDVQASFAMRPVKAVTGDYPTLSELGECYGKETPSAWLVPQVADLMRFTGTRHLNEKQQEQLADILAVEGRGLKVTELMLFFYRFKTGRYGRFYGAVDPMVITTALQDFLRERQEIIDSHADEVAAAWDTEARRRCTPLLADIAKGTGLQAGTDIYVFTTEPYRRRLLLSIGSADAEQRITAPQPWQQYLQAVARHFPEDFGQVVLRRGYAGVESRDNDTT